MNTITSIFLDVFIGLVSLWFVLMIVLIVYVIMIIKELKKASQNIGSVSESLKGILTGISFGKALQYLIKKVQKSSK